MNVLSLCDYSGNAVRPWLDAGHDAWIVDLQHPAGFTEEIVGNGVLTRVGANVLDLVGRDGTSLCGWIEWDMVLAWPPCDHLSVSGARWMKNKGLGALVLALEIVESCRTICEQSNAPYLLENPVSTLSTYWRKPDHRFHPWHYNRDRIEDTYWKNTCLWIGGGLEMPEMDVDPRTIDVMAKAKAKYPDLNRTQLIKAVQADPELDSDWFPDDRIHKAAPGPDRANFRSATPVGFAQAVFEANTDAVPHGER